MSTAVSTAEHYAIMAALQTEMREASNGEPAPEIPVVEHFGDGLYSRTITITAGTLFVGAIHKSGCINIISGGEILVYTEEGRVLYDGTTTAEVFRSGAGLQRGGLCLSDTKWTTIHATNVTDPSLIWDELITTHLPG